MDTKEQAPVLAKATSRRPIHLPTLLLVVAGLAASSAALVVYSLSGADPAPKKEPTGKSWVFTEVFPTWPKDRKPDFVIVISGQTYGYLQKCGCSDPQKGGLERRYNFIQGFKENGIEAIPIDLGDIPPQVSEDTKILHQQALLKYKTAMRSLKMMGYKVIGLGKEEFALGLHEAIGEYSLQPGNELPRILGANLLGFQAGDKVLDKKTAFPDSTGLETAIRDWEIIPTAKKINIGVVGIIGGSNDPKQVSLINDIKKIDPKMAFAEPPANSTVKVVSKALTEMAGNANKPDVNVLLYSGPLDLAKKAAETFPNFQIVVCRSEEAEPPNAPMMLVDAAKNLNTMIVRVGHKGQTLGVVGVYKNNKGGFDYQFQRVAMTPEFDTPAGKEKENLALQELESYSKTVKARGFLSMNQKSPHSLQISNPNAFYTGSDACMVCHKEHDNSGAIYAGSKHAQAYSALEKIATKPSLRNFDGECIRCHTVGYDYNSGYVNETKTPTLKNVGCESCHGPGSAHAAAPMNKQWALELSPWKINGQGKMPDAEKLKAYLAEQNPAKKQGILNQEELRVMLKVDRTCQTCHNAENDPHFKIETFWPKIAHSAKPAAKGNVQVPLKDKVPIPTPPIGLPMPLPK
ncbi:MAG: hypothetical protein K8T89_19305 [Planctomycetes bacterium]|nr:hypothetical protein [Planctomycetota bacterium]